MNHDGVPGAVIVAPLLAQGIKDALQPLAVVVHVQPVVDTVEVGADAAQIIVGPLSKSVQDAVGRASGRDNRLIFFI